MIQPLLEVDALQTRFQTPQGLVHAVDGVSFSLPAGGTLGIVGESGSGKSVLARSLLRLLPAAPMTQHAGQVRYRGQDLLTLGESALRKLRGKEIAMIFQDPMTSLNPVLTIGAQIIQVLRTHESLSVTQARERALELLSQVRIPAPRARLDEYPHQLSGGMRQRAVIAIALACSPSLLIADEPTTALDVTVQAQILDLLNTLQASHGMALILISHDLGVVAGMCDRVAVMYGGRIVEQADAASLFATPRMRYTRALFAAMPSIHAQSHQPLAAIPGAPPSLLELPAGCRFTARCAHALKICERDSPDDSRFGEDHLAACWNPATGEDIGR